MAPSCFVGGYDRSAQGGQGAYGDDHSPAPKERKSVMRKLATQAALGKQVSANDSFTIDPAASTTEGWTKLEPIKQ